MGKLIFALFTFLACVAHADVAGVQPVTVYAEYFGVICDGSSGHDNTDEINAAIEASRRSDGASNAQYRGTRVLLPPGQCLISGTITVRDMWSFTLEGAGPRSTSLYWSRSASSSKAAIELLDCRYCTVKNLGIEASSANGTDVELDTAIRISNDGTTSNVLSSSNLISDVDINGTSGAIRVGIAVIDGPGTYPTNASNNEHHMFRRVRVSNFVDYGFQIGGTHTLVTGGPGGSNYKQNRFDECECACGGGKRCVYQYQGSFNWTGGNASTCTEAVFYIQGTAGPVAIMNPDGENSARFLFVAGPTGASRNVTVIGGRSSATPEDMAADGCWFYLGGKGPYTLIGGEHGGLDAAAGICHEPGGTDPKEVSVSVMGTRWQTTLSTISGTAYCSTHTCKAPVLYQTLRSNEDNTQPHAWP